MDEYVSLGSILEELGAEVSQKIDKFDTRDSFEHNILRVYGYNLKLIRAEMTRHKGEVEKYRGKIQGLKRSLWWNRIIGMILFLKLLMINFLYWVYVRV